ncbi:Tetratricopeptide repeat protein [anaerobic digester metagenome]
MKKNILILFLLICTSFIAGAQNAIISADSLNTLAEEMRQTDNDASLKLAKAAWKISSQQNDTATMAASLLNIGLAQYYLSQYDNAATSFKESYRLYKSVGHKPGMSAAANDIGMLYYQQSDFELAEKYYQISFNIDKSLNDTAGMAVGLNNLGEIYQIRGDYSKSLRMFLLSGEMERKSGNPFGEAQSWINVGTVFCESGNTKKGNEFYKKALAYFNSTGNNQYISLTLANIGDNYRIERNFAKARDFLSKAIKLSAEGKYDLELIQAQIYFSYLLADENKPDSAEYILFEALNRCVETNNNRLACEALMQQGFLLSDKKQYHEANQYLLNAYEFASDMQYKTGLKKILQQLSENYSALGEFENALKYQKMAASTDVPTIANKSAANIENSMEPDNSSMQTLLYGLILGAFLILLLTTIYFYVRMKYYKNLAESHSPAGEERK